MKPQPTTNYDATRQAECLVLSSLMLDDVAGEGKLLSRYGETIKPDWFLDERNRTIFEAIRAVREAEVKASIAGLGEWIMQTKRVFDWAHLAEVAAMASAPWIELPHYLERVVDGYKSRLLAHGASGAVLALKGGNEPSGQVEALSGLLERLQGLSLDAEEESGGTDAKALSQAFVDRAENWKANAGQGFGWPTGLPCLEKFDLRLYRTQRLVVAGETNVGKSTLAAQIALNVAEYFKDHEPGLKVGILSLEDGKERWVDRAIANLSQVPLPKIRKGSASKIELGDIFRATLRFAELPLLVETQAGLTVEGMPAVFQSLVDRGCAFVVVDYLQEIGAKGAKDLREKVTQACRDLKTLAINHDISVLMVSSLRKLDGRRPTVEDLKESGDVGYVATEVVALRVLKPPEDPSDPVMLGVDVLKQKDGPKGCAAALLRGPVFRIEEVAKEEAEEAARSEPKPKPRRKQPRHWQEN